MSEGKFSNIQVIKDSLQQVISSAFGLQVPEKIIADSKDLLERFNVLESRFLGDDGVYEGQSDKRGLEKLIQSYEDITDQITKELSRSGIDMQNVLDGLGAQNDLVVKNLKELLPTARQNLSEVYKRLELMRDARLLLERVSAIELDLSEDLSVKGENEDKLLKGLRADKIVIERLIQRYDDTQAQITIELNRPERDINVLPLEVLRGERDKVIQDIRFLLPKVQKNLDEVQVRSAQQDGDRQLILEDDEWSKKMDDIDAMISEIESEIMLQGNPRENETLVTVGTGMDEESLVDVRRKVTEGVSGERNNKRKDEKLLALRTDVDEATDIMRKNIDAVLDRGDKLEDLVARADKLEEEAGEFNFLSRRVKRQNKSSWNKPVIVCGAVTAVGSVALFSTGVAGHAASALKFSLLSLSAVFFVTAIAIKHFGAVRTKISDVRPTVVPKAEMQH